MKKLLLFFLLFLSFGFSFAQSKDSLSLKEQERRRQNIEAGNPFKKFGYTPKIATLSKGKYLEWHDLDSIVRIGSYSFHVKKKEIVGYDSSSNKNSETTLRPEIPSRWISPDPLAEEFPDWSPYNYVMNNPIRMIDPTGLAPEDWYADNDGNLIYNENIRSQDNLDEAGIDGEYIAESFVGIDQNQSVYQFNNDGTVEKSSQNKIEEDNTVIAIETSIGVMTEKTTPNKGKQFLQEAGVAVVVSQADSPAPGPADIIALGMLFNAVKNLIIPQEIEGYYNLQFAKSKKGKTSARQTEVQHGNQGTGKLKGSKKTKHQKRRPGDKGEKKRQKPGWKQF